MKQFEARVQEGTEAPVRRSYALYVFFLCFFLMLLDYMARQVVVSMFPVLKAQWGLSDTRLGALVSAVSLAGRGVRRAPPPVAGPFNPGEGPPGVGPLLGA